MLDDFRKTAAEPSQQENSPQPEKYSTPPEEGKKILGMNAKQRFVVSLLLLVSICLLGSLCLIVFGKVYLP